MEGVVAVKSFDGAIVYSQPAQEGGVVSGIREVEAGGV
jgi:hypothetical protein